MGVVNSAKIFTQTCRTILFEHFSDDDACTDLARVLDTVGEDGRLTAQSREELGLLTVKSFKEFVERFTPPVYEIIHPPKVDDAGNYTGPPIFEYTLSKERAGKFFHTEKRLNDQLYYDMLMQIYKDKGSSRTADYEFDDSELLKMMTPQAESDKLRRLRKQAEDNFARAYFAEKKGENITPFLDKYDAAMDAVKEIQDDKMVIIAQRLSDIAVLTPPKGQDGEKVKELPADVAGYLAYDESGHLTFKAQNSVKVLPTPNQLTGGQDQADIKLLGAEQIRQDIENDYNAYVPEERRDNYVLTVLKKAMAPISEKDADLPALERVE